MRFIFSLLLFVSLNCFSQYKNFIIGVRGDTLNRVDAKGLKQGPWFLHVDELRGEPGYDEQGYYIDDKKDGLWVQFSQEGVRTAEENYKWGSKHGKCSYFTRNGGLFRVESWWAVDPKKTMDTVDVFDINDPTKVVDKVIVKMEGQTNKHGTWTYYEPVWGTVQKTEYYFLDKLKTDAGNGETEEDIKPLPIGAVKGGNDSLGNKIKPKIVQDYEKKNSGKKKIKVRDGSTGF